VHAEHVCIIAVAVYAITAALQAHGRALPAACRQLLATPCTFTMAASAGMKRSNTQLHWLQHHRRAQHTRSLIVFMVLYLLLLQRGMEEEKAIQFMALAHTDSGIVTAVRGEHRRHTSTYSYVP
jgi:hypothetical protein